MDKQLEYYSKKRQEALNKRDYHAFDYWNNQYKMQYQTLYSLRKKTVDEIRLYYMGIGYQMCKNEHNRSKGEHLAVTDLMVSDNLTPFIEGMKREEHKELKRRASYRYRKSGYNF